MSRVRKPWGEVDWGSSRIEITRCSLRVPEIRMQSTPMEELIAGLPDASGEFTGYFDTGVMEDFYNRLLGPGLDTLGMSADACSPDVSQPYPF